MKGVKFQNATNLIQSEITEFPDTILCKVKNEQGGARNGAHLHTVEKSGSKMLEIRDILFMSDVDFQNAATTKQQCTLETPKEEPLSKKKLKQRLTL